MASKLCNLSASIFLEDVIEREHRRFPADLKAWRKRAKSKTSPWRIDPRAAKPNWADPKN
jgi:hypothetical protein